VRLNRLFRLTVASIAVCAVLSWPGVAQAGDGLKPVNCSKTPSAPRCKVSVGTPQRPGGTQPSQNNGSSGGSDSGDDEWDGCVYEPAPGNLAPPAGKKSGDGGWYVEVCLIGDGKGGPQTSAPMWIDGPAPAAVDPAVVARQAVSQLNLPAPEIRVNPAANAARLVRVPVWLWVDQSTWGPRSATASVPGLSVTATATPEQVSWKPGDGTAPVVCAGAGTPWRAGMNPSSTSSCSHPYQKSGRYTLTATVTWTVSWAGGGQTGTVPDLTSTNSIVLPVRKNEALNTNGG
jgi:hypothetical protein